MVCPKCGVNDQQKIISTRRRVQDYILRRRECVCGYRFNTVEIMELNETTMRVLEREMIKNSKPRAFSQIIHLTYRKIFDRYRYLEDKRLEKEHDTRRIAE